MKKDTKGVKENQDLKFKNGNGSHKEVMKNGLMDFVISAGLETLHEMIDESIESLCGERYRHISEREFIRWSMKKTKIILGGKKIEIKHNRVRSFKTYQEKALEILEYLKNEDLLQDRVFENMTIGISTRKYKRALEANSKSIVVSNISKSSVSRDFIVKSTAKLQEWLNEPIKDEYPFLMIDGIVFKKATVVIVLGIDRCGNKKVLGAWEGSTENARLCTDLLQNLIERELNTSKVKLVIIDGSKALRKAVTDVLGNEILIQRCQLHKKRNVLDYLPKEKQKSVFIAMSEAYRQEDYDTSHKLLMNLSNRLKKDFPKASTSLLEGLEETLTLVKLKAGKEIRKALCTTNPIESLNSNIKYITKRVKRWRDDKMVIRWVCTAVIESQKNFRKINGYHQIENLLNELETNDKKRIDNKEYVA